VEDTPPRPLSPYPVRAARSALAALWGTTMIALLVPFGIVTLPLDRKQRMHDFFSARGAGSILSLLGIHVEVRGVEHLSQEGRYVVVANHRSLIDTLILLHVLQRHTPIRFIAKRSVFKVPILGWGMRAFGHMAVDHKSIWSSLPGLRSAAASGRRWSTVFFPEGTRSRDGNMLPFKQAPFKIAARLGLPVLPVAIRDSAGALPPGTLVSNAPATVVVEVFPPLPLSADDADGDGDGNAAAVAERARSVIEGALSRPSSA
jgi:1-acyl-sn-glycerol-3-phosphate acyltransferase